MDTVELNDAIEAAKYLEKAAKLLHPKQPYTVIELLAAWHRGIETIKPVLKKFQ